MKRIILIGGMPTAGKSTLAKKLSDHFGLPWMSTDQIRGIMQSAISSSDKTPLNSSAGMSAEEYLTTFTAQEVADKEYDQSTAVWLGITYMINSDWSWGEGFILEGVNILPQLVAIEQAKRDNIQAIFLSDRDLERTRDVVFTRGLYGKADSYSDSVKEKEIEWVHLYDDMIRREAEKHSLPIINIEKNNSDLGRILKILS